MAENHRSSRRDAWAATRTGPHAEPRLHDILEQRKSVLRMNLNAYLPGERGRRARGRPLPGRTRSYGISFQSKEQRCSVAKEERATGIGGVKYKNRSLDTL
jgi:hypothetical protein